MGQTQSDVALAVMRKVHKMPLPPARVTFFEIPKHCVIDISHLGIHDIKTRELFDEVVYLFRNESVALCEKGKKFISIPLRNKVVLKRILLREDTK